MNDDVPYAPGDLIAAREADTGFALWSKNDPPLGFNDVVMEGCKLALILYVEPDSPKFLSVVALDCQTLKTGWCSMRFFERLDDL